MQRSTLVPPIAKIHTSESTERNIIKNLLPAAAAKGYFFTSPSLLFFLQEFVQKKLDGWRGGGYLVSHLMLSPQIITLGDGEIAITYISKQLNFENTFLLLQRFAKIQDAVICGIRYKWYFLQRNWQFDTGVDRAPS